jgi:hypothetical protein
MNAVPFWVVVMLTWLTAFAITVILLRVAPAHILPNGRLDLARWRSINL